ncbi:hypothetical protein EGR_09313 [Echinococcus granulosus]|uniref:Uncharacterized protein n=1 Tax=Echinococcus granulosus TaxID=6210 RepID=W6UQZ5_ECHGR|nr:hypothetical protein EGR_09313 [Echinococcus granulosus]EUB55839.1 hypothetical protein EGR_09313 [Echinococcus granulosus]
MRYLSAKSLIPLGKSTGSKIVSYLVTVLEKRECADHTFTSLVSEKLDKSKFCLRYYIFRQEFSEEYPKNVTENQQSFSFLHNVANSRNTCTILPFRLVKQQCSDNLVQSKPCDQFFKLDCNKLCFVIALTQAIEARDQKFLLANFFRILKYPYKSRKQFRLFYIFHFYVLTSVLNKEN